MGFEPPVIYMVVAGLTAATSDSVLARRLEQGETELIEDFRGTL